LFTGLIEAVGEVEELVPRRGSSRLTVRVPAPFEQTAEGESIAVDGVCLTVAARSPERLQFDAVAETLARTTLGRLRRGTRVNLERALSLGDRLGGHLVQGHVDAVTTVSRVTTRGDDRRVALRRVPEIRSYVAFKGSIALQGVSLTIARVERATFEVALIPETVRRTTLGDLRPGDPVNVEVDVLARYLETLLRARRGGTR